METMVVSRGISHTRRARGRQAVMARSLRRRDPGSFPGPSVSVVTAPAKERPLALVVSRDGALLDLVRAAYDSNWKVETRTEAVAGRELIEGANVRIVVVDDGALEANDRGWLLNRIRRGSPDAFVLYVADRHSSQVEREARAGGAAYYASKPFDSEQLARVLRSVGDCFQQSRVTKAN
jgi:DNA-binding response OmpR family regulator